MRLVHCRICARGQLCWKRIICEMGIEPHALTHWGRVTHICVSYIITIGSDNGLSPGRRQAIIWTNDGILLIGPLGTNFNEILIEIHTFSFKKIHVKMSSAKWRPFCLGLNVLNAPSPLPVADPRADPQPAIQMTFWPQTRRIPRCRCRMPVPDVPQPWPPSPWHPHHWKAADCAGSWQSDWYVYSCCQRPRQSGSLQDRKTLRH